MSTRHEFKPANYLLWATVFAFLYGLILLIVYEMVCALLPVVPVNPVLNTGFILVLLVTLLACISAPYTKLAVTVSERGISLPVPVESISLGGPSGTDLSGLIFYVPVLMLEMFSPRYEISNWLDIKSVCFEKKWFWSHLKIESGAVTYLMSYPLNRTQVFKKAVMQYAPEGNPLRVWVEENVK